jgi:tyrosinase
MKTGKKMARRNWARLNSSQRQTIINGFQRAKQSGVYDQLVQKHQLAMLGGPNDWHQLPIFLPVHRWFLKQLESAMGTEVAYWDWTAQPTLPSGLGGNGDPTQSWRVTTGPFATWVATIYDSSNGTFVQRQPPGLVRQFGAAANSLPTTADMTKVLSTTPYDSYSWDSYSAGFRALEEGGSGSPAPYFHNRVHEWVGGDMRTGTSPNDPVFWMHHANIDRIWAGWQKRYGVTTYAGPAGEGADDPMPLTNGATPRQMFPLPSYDLLP